MFTLSACKQTDTSHREDALQNEEVGHPDVEVSDVAEVENNLIEDIPEVPKRIIRVEVLREDAEGTSRSSIEYKYDDINYITSQYFYDEEGNLTGSAIEECDSNGNVINRTSYDESGDINSRIDTTYNADGQEITSSHDETDFFNNEKITYILENVYNESGELVKTIRNEDGNSYTEIEYEYDNGRLIHSKNYFSDGTFFFETDYIYDKQGNLLEEDTKYPDKYIGTYLFMENSRTKTEYEYNENGNKVKETSFRDGKFSESFEYEYDECGNILVEKYASLEKTEKWWFTEIKTYEYENIP